MPLDDDGFLRRECPHCSREFKWLHSEEGSSDEPDPDGYHCPYCDGRSVDGWWTHAQLAAIQDEAQHYMQSRFHEMFKGLERRSSKSVTFKAGAAPARSSRPGLTEQNDMRRVDFPCHPAEPIKVLEDWTAPVHCIVCGQSTN